MQYLSVFDCSDVIEPLTSYVIIATATNATLPSNSTAGNGGNGGSGSSEAIVLFNGISQSGNLSTAASYRRYIFYVNTTSTNTTTSREW